MFYLLKNDIKYKSNEQTTHTAQGALTAASTTNLQNFMFMLPSEIIETRKSTFEIKVSKCNSMLYYFNISL